MRLLALVLAPLAWASCITPDDIDARLDPDGDGWDDDADCDDEDSGVNPGAEEVCDNGKDDDCDPATDCRSGSGGASELGVSLSLVARPKALAWLPGGAAEGGMVVVDANGDLARYALNENATLHSRARINFCTAPAAGAAVQVGDGDADGEPDLLVDCWGAAARTAWWSGEDAVGLGPSSAEVDWERDDEGAPVALALRPPASFAGPALVGMHGSTDPEWVSLTHLAEGTPVTRDACRPLGPASEAPARLTALFDPSGTLPPSLITTPAPSAGAQPSTRDWPNDQATLPLGQGIAGMVTGETLHVTASAVDLTGDGEPDAVGHIEGGAAGTHRIFAAAWPTGASGLDLASGLIFADSATAWSILGVATPDLDHDGQADLAALLVHEGAWHVAVAWGPLAPSEKDFDAFDFTIHLGEGPPSEAYIAHGDVDDDGWDDLLVAESASTPRLWAFLGQGQ